MKRKLCENIIVRHEGVQNQRNSIWLRAHHSNAVIFDDVILLHCYESVLTFLFDCPSNL